MTITQVAGIWYAVWRDRTRGLSFVMAPTRDRAVAKALYSIFA